jgi:hypothetical protein
MNEIDDGSHDVELDVQDAYCIGVKGRDHRAVPGRALELCDSQHAGNPGVVTVDYAATDANRRNS